MENAFHVHEKMSRDGTAWQTLRGFDVDDHVRDELWAAGVAVARGHPLCLHLLAFCEQRSLHPSLCKSVVLVTTEAFAQQVKLLYR